MKLPITKDQFDWWVDNIASPAAPLAWFKRFQAAAGPPRWAMAVASYLVLILWAVVFMWLWFAVFCVLFLYEGLGLAPWTRTPGSSAPPAEPQH